MSAQALNWAIDQPTGITEKVVLIALARQANARGEVGRIDEVEIRRITGIRDRNGLLRPLVGLADKELVDGVRFAAGKGFTGRSVQLLMPGVENGLRAVA